VLNPRITGGCIPSTLLRCVIRLAAGRDSNHNPVLYLVICQALLDIWFSLHLSQNFVSCYISIVQPLMFSLYYILLILNDKDILVSRFRCFHKTAGHQYILPFLFLSEIFVHKNDERYQLYVTVYLLL
jgi:hypothetical protein